MLSNGFYWTILPIALVWLSLHYRGGRRDLIRRVQAAERALADMTELAQRLHARVETLERVLDMGEPAPGQRS